MASRSAAEQELLAPAQAGEEEAFERLTSPVRRELQLHCYRMLGSLHDADDALQDTLVRAWRGIARFEPRAPLQTWLYRIATNVCLSALADRGRRPEEPRVDPLPDHLLDEFDPETQTVERERVELAFVAAVQLLPPRQRAVLLLRDVLGWSAREAAELLETSVASVNSALQRARATLEREREAGRLTRPHCPPEAEVERVLVRRFVEAWQATDVDGLVCLLAEDALLTMPPLPIRVSGRDAVGEFLSTRPADGQLHRFRLVATRANGRPAVGFYPWNDDQGEPVKKIQVKLSSPKPPQAVYDYLVDFERHPEWRFDVLESKLVGGEKGRPGARYHQRIKPGRKEMEANVELTEAEPGRRVGFRTIDDAPVTASGTYTISQSGSGSELVNDVAIEANGFVRIFEPFMGPGLRKTAQRYEEALTERLR